jgi:hypothetical protein
MGLSFRPIAPPYEDSIWPGSTDNPGGRSPLAGGTRRRATSGATAVAARLKLGARPNVKEFAPDGILGGLRRLGSENAGRLVPRLKA